MGYLGRDVEVVLINQAQYLVASCDSCGAIGMKDLDTLKITWSITGRLTTRVALLEVLSTGAVPQMMTVAISNELHPTGEQILKGVQQELDSAGLSTLSMAISTEKNMVTQQTGLGISVIGVSEKYQLRVGITQAGDDVYCLGLPKVGPEVNNPNDTEIVQVKHIQFLLDILGVHDIVPVGSRGIRTEAQQLATNLNCQLFFDPACGLDLDKSAGPSTCLIFSALSSLASDILLSSFPRLPITKVGRLSKI
ncbi:alpha-ribazole kinase [Desulfosporosinus fructosivorans]|uniref:Alpha-ribazole kinase n=1 Tax=Desulfosporosinus fructosivorans TaxID=2018669 RepID=A0A4Z0R0P7_9FIRM|nr:alpha-ribazole kinase [Desulfosporosinus fructosivorans]TGE36099.1 alpha-ribazole kinase [Desulfosporosinus fructosivorans]